MAIGTHVIPVLLGAGPVQLITCIDGQFRIQVKPALPAVTFRPAIPCNSQCLHPAIRKLNQVLLQGYDTKGIFDFKILHAAICSVGINPEFAVFGKEPGDNAICCEFGIVKVTEHGVFGGMLHRQIMMRTLPTLLLFGMAGKTTFAAGKFVLSSICTGYAGQ